MSKACTKCKEEKPLQKFYKNKGGKDGLNSKCKNCRRIYAQQHRKKNIEHYRLESKKKRLKLKANRARVLDWITDKYSGIPCMDCERVFSWCAMDFDHRPGEIKELKIGSMGCRKATSSLLAKVEKEIAKCDLVCACCHRIRTWDRKNND